MSVSSWDVDRFLAGLGQLQFMAPELLRLFVSSMEHKMNILHKALQSNDIATILQVAHHVKGTAGQVHCVSLANIARQIEQCPITKQPDLLTDYCQQLIIQVAVDLSLIEEYLKASEQA